SFVDDPLALATDANFSAIAENLVTDARLGPAFRAHNLNVARMNRRFALDDAPFDVLAGVRLGVALDHVHAFDNQPVLVRHDLQDAAPLSAVLAGHDEHVVVLSNRSS